MPKRTGDFDNWLLNELGDPKLASEYVNAAISEDPALLPAVLREVAKAYTMKKVARDAGVARESLYTILSVGGNPTLANLTAVLKAVRLRIAVLPDFEESSAREYRIEHPVADRLGIGRHASHEVAALSGPANTSVATLTYAGLSGLEPQPGVGYFNFRALPVLGAGTFETVTLGSKLFGIGSGFERELQERGGAADSGNAAFAPVQMYVREFARQVGGGSEQLAA